MRLLVACPACRRQYDAAGHSIGSRFRCRCGEVISIAQPKGHDATVVRCGSCGAPRHDGNSKCSFCGADFTLRQRDLDTICPHCLARIGDHSKFCDHCGNPLAAESLTIEETPLTCPACGTGAKLHSRLIGGNAVCECPSCAGLWVGIQTFRHLVQEAGREGQRTTDHREPPPLPSPHPLDGAERPEHHKYIPCPECHGLMMRQNFAHRSRVIVDICKRHGIWFDGDKLSRILEWVRSGGLAAANEELAANAAREARAESRLHRERAGGSPLFDNDYRDGDHSTVDWAIDAFGSFFGL